MNLANIVRHPRIVLIDRDSPETKEQLLLFSTGVIVSHQINRDTLALVGLPD